MLHDYFPHIFCINLPRRTDRLVQAKEEFAKHGIVVEFVEAVDGMELDMPNCTSSDGTPVSRGDLGCTLSHLKVAQIAKCRQLPSYFVFEDDVELHPDFNKLLPLYLGYFPHDWDMLYLGGSHNQPVIPIDEFLAKMTLTYTTHAMAIAASMYNPLIEIWGRKNEKVDIGIASLHRNNNCYTCTPPLAWQRPSYSDILERDTNYEHLKQ